MHEMTSDQDPLLRLESGATEIALIRHGDALRGPEEVEAGSYDEQGLSALGRRQAAALAEALRTLSFAAIYASPAKRAYQTAEVIAAFQGLPVIAEVNLREVDLSGVRPSAAADASPEERAALLRTYLRGMERQALAIGIWDQIVGPGASEAIRTRMARAVDDLAARHPGQRIAIASHAGAINAYIAQFLGIARDFFFPIANTAISTVRVHSERHLLIELNNTAHLTAAGMTRSGR